MKILALLLLAVAPSSSLGAGGLRATEPEVLRPQVESAGVPAAGDDAHGLALVELEEDDDGQDLVAHAVRGELHAPPTLGLAVAVLCGAGEGPAFDVPRRPPRAS